MNELQIFKNEEFGFVRTVMVNGEPYFVGKDVSEILGYSNASKALSDHVDAEDKLNNESLSSLGQRGGWLVNESGLYSLIISSKLSTAKRFKRWITGEVLPSIRKNGGYIIGQENFSDEELLAKALIVAKNTISRREARIKTLECENAMLTVDKAIMQPKAEYFDDLVDRNLLTSLRDTAKELNIKERAFIKFLLEKKYLYRDKKGKLTPYSGKGDGLFEVKECFNEKTNWSGSQTLVTPKGRETFRILFIGA